MICLDTSVLIWGVQGVARASQTEMIGRTTQYLHRLSDEGADIMLPAPVIVEYLAGFPPEQHAAQLQVLQERFWIAAFDLPAAAIAAELESRREVVREVVRDGGIPRPSIKVDVQIIATAIAHRAERIVTANLDEFRKLADGRIEVAGVPPIDAAP